MKTFKISVHIPFYLSNKTEKKRIRNFKKICQSFVKLSSKSKIFVHTNKKIHNSNKKIQFIYYNFKKDHPFKLTWYCRKMMEKQKNRFDVFIYSEDDILFTKKNFNYWLNYKDVCIKNNYNLGFLRAELNKKNKKLYSTDQIEKANYFVKIMKKKFFVLKNPFYGFWIYDKNEFNKFVKTKWWSFNWNLRSVSGILHLREMAGWGWHGENLNGLHMGRYLATIIPLKNMRPDKSSHVRHLSDNYANSPKGLFGTICLDNLLSKNLQIFRPDTIVTKVFKRIKNLTYYFLRINIKNIFKKNKLHHDLLKR